MAQCTSLLLLTLTNYSRLEWLRSLIRMPVVPSYHMGSARKGSNPLAGVFFIFYVVFFACDTCTCRLLQLTPANGR